MRVILDTSVIVSGLLSLKGPPAQLISHWLAGRFTLLYTPAMLAELADVLQQVWLHERLANVPNRVPEFLAALRLLGVPVQGHLNVTGQVRDPFDEMFLICAALGQADYLVSGDKDLLTLRQFQGTQIVTAAQFVALLA